MNSSFGKLYCDFIMNSPPNGGTQEKYSLHNSTLSDLLPSICEGIEKVNDNAKLCKLYFMPCWGIHTSLFTRCGTTACVPILSDDRFSHYEGEYQSAFRSFVISNHALKWFIENKSYQSMMFSSYLILLFVMVRISINCPLWRTVKHKW